MLEKGVVMGFDGISQTQIPNTPEYQTNISTITLYFPNHQISVNLESAAKKCEWFNSKRDRWQTESSKIDMHCSTFVSDLLAKFLNEPNLEKAIFAILDSHPTHEELWELTKLLDYFQAKPNLLAAFFKALETLDKEVVLSFNQQRTVLTVDVKGAEVLVQACRSDNQQSHSDDLRMDKIQFWLEHDMKEIKIREILEKDDNEIGEKILELLPEMKQLSSLNLKLARVHGEKLIGIITQLTELHTLHIENAIQIKEEHLRDLFTLEKLKDLSLKSCLGINRLPTPNTQLKLTSLNIANSTRIDPDSLVKFCEQCPDLTALNISNCIQINKKALQAIKDDHSNLEVNSKGCRQLELQKSIIYLQHHFH